MLSDLNKSYRRRRSAGKLILAACVLLVASAGDALAQGLFVSSVSVERDVVYGGQSITGLVRVNGIRVNDITIALSVNNQSVTIPASVTVPRANTTGVVTFSITARPVQSKMAVTITASLGSSSRATTITVFPPRLLRLRVQPSTVIGGSGGATGTIDLSLDTLSGDDVTFSTVVSLSTNLPMNNRSVTVPSSVTVPGNTTSAAFQIATQTVTSSITVTITASLDNIERTATITVQPPPPTLSSISLNSTSITGGGSVAGTVTLSGAAPTATTVTLSSSSASVATVTPTAVTVAAGATTAAFQVSTTAVASQVSVTITATLGSVSRTTTLAVQPAPPTLSAVSLNPSSVTGSTAVTGTVTLTGPAVPAAGSTVIPFTVALLSSSSVATVPASVTVPAGSTTANFNVMTSPVTAPVNVTITATVGNVSRTATLTVNPPLTITSPSQLPSPAPGSAYSYTLTATGGSGSGYTWSATGLPAWLTLSASGTLSGAPPTGASAATFTVGVRDSAGNSATKSVTVPFGVTITSSNPLPPATPGSAYSFTFTASGGTGTGYTWSASGLPAWLTLQPTGVLSGSPPADANSIPSLLVAVRDSGGNTGAGSFALPVVGARPVLTTLTPPSIAAGGSSFNLTVTGSGFLAGAVVFWNTTPLATTVVSSAQLVAVVGASLIESPEAVSISVSSNSTTSNALPFAITTRVRITTISPLLMATVGEPYLQAFAAAGGSGSYQWTAGLPSWLTLSPAGVLTGVPLAGTPSVNFTVTVTDSTGGTATSNFVLPVGAALTISPATLPSGAPDATYVFAFQASGGSGGGYTWTAARLPVWLTLSPTGLLKGTPPATSVGNYAFTVSVKDVGGATASGSYSLTITPRPSPAVSSISPGNVTAGGLPFTLSVTGSNFAQTALAQWNGSPLPTSVTDSSHLSANVSASLIAAAGSADVTVSSLSVISNASPLKIAGPPPAGLTLSQTGFTFQVVQNGPPPVPQAFRVLSAGEPLSYSVVASTLEIGPAWLSATPLGGSTDFSPTVTVQVDPTGLQPGDYYGQLKVSSTGASNPQLVSVVLIVASPSVTLGPVVEPVGLLFVGAPGGVAPPSRGLTLQNPNARDIAFTSSAVFPNETQWFTYEPTAGVVPGGRQLTVNVRPSVANLAPAVYQAQLQFQFADGPKRLVTLVLVVGAGAQGGGSRLLSTRNDSACSPSLLIPVVVLLAGGEGFQVPAGASTPIAVVAVDDCGVPLESTGSVTASFSNGDPSLPLRSLGAAPGDDVLSARWTGTWPARNTRTETMMVTITAENNARTRKGVMYVSGRVDEILTAPMIGDGAIMGSAAFNSGPAPGSLVTIAGSRLADTVTPGNSVPRPLDLQGTSVVLGESALPLLYSAPDQINAIIPFGVTANMTHSIVVRRGRRQSAVQTVSINEFQPAIFTTNGSGTGQGHIYNATHGFALAGPASPAVAGDVLVLYCAGLGRVDPAVAAGNAAPLSPLSQTVMQPVVTIGEVPAKVEFSGLAPTYTGLYQINAVMPQGVAAGDAVKVVVTAGTVSSPPVTIAVR